MRVGTRLMGVVAVLCVMMRGGAGIALEGTVTESLSGTVGPDRVPYTLVRIEKAADYSGLPSWIERSYPGGEESAVHCLPQTIMTGRLAGMPAAAFKTWEMSNYVQKVVVDAGGSLILLSTPHGAYNPDGATVLRALIGIALPVTECTTLSEESQPALEETAASMLDMVTGLSLSKGSSFGTKVGSYSGVDAYSNGSTGYVSGVSNYYSGYRTGIKWQCVEYVDRYFKAKFGKGITGGNANTYYSSASSKKLNRAANGDANKPQAGNILCSGGGDYGHVAIIREVGSNYVKVIHQNWSNSSSDDSKKLSMTVKTKSGKKYYTISGFSSSYPVQGWLWPK